MKPDVAIDTGVVLFTGKARDALVKLASSDTFKGCTSRGVEDGAAALRLELYLDLLLALKTDAGADPGTVVVCIPELTLIHRTPLMLSWLACATDGDFKCHNFVAYRFGVPHVSCSTNLKSHHFLLSKFHSLLASDGNGHDLMPFSDPIYAHVAHTKQLRPLVF